MSTKKTTTNTLSFDPTAMGVYQNSTQQLGSYIGDTLGNPFQSAAFNARLQMGAKQAQQLGLTQMRSLAPMAQRLGGGSPFFASQVGRTARATSANQSTSFTNALMLQEQLRQNAAGIAAGFRPLQTGSQSVEQTSGLGTWLPQVASLGLGLATAPFMGGTSLLNGTKNMSNVVADMPLNKVNPLLFNNFSSSGWFGGK